MSTLAHPSHDFSRPPPAPGMGRGFALALVAHALLVIGLTLGVQWRSTTEPAFEAELWAAVPVAAAPREQAPPPEPEPEVVTPPKPTPVPEPPPPDLQAQRDAEIAVAKAREEKKKKREEELEAKRLAEQEAERKQREQDKKDQALKDKKLKEEKAREQQAREDKAEKAEKAEKARQDAKKADAQAEKQRQENLRRIQGMAGASGGPQATGTALQSAGPSASYAGRIKARIRPNIIYSEAPSGNPVAEVEVRAAPDGRIIGSRLSKPSGDSEWDKAVLRAIDKTEMLPRDTDGRVPSHLVISFQPRE
jgi:colicin import membrane protein